MGKVIHYALVVMITAALSTAILGMLNYSTMSRLEEMDKKTQSEARKIALSDAVGFDETKKKNIDGIEFIPGVDANNAIVGYVATVNTPAYGAKGVTFVMGIGMDGTIKGIKITDSTGETPGLGTLINKEEWLSHWKGKDITYSFVKKVFPEGDAFAGATISPEGVYKGMQKALKAFEAVKGGIANGQ